MPSCSTSSRICMSGRPGLSNLGISGNRSADKSSLQDQDK